MVRMVSSSAGEGPGLVISRGFRESFFGGLRTGGGQRQTGMAAVAMLPLPSIVTISTLPCCAALLAADTIPGAARMLVAVPNIIWFAAVACAPKPSAALDGKPAEALAPSAVLKLALAVAVSPTATVSLASARPAKPKAVLAMPVELDSWPIATLPWLVALASLPNAIAEMELALALKPNPIAASALALALMPIAVAPVPGE